MFVTSKSIHKAFSQSLVVMGKNVGCTCSANVEQSSILCLYFDDGIIQCLPCEQFSAIIFFFLFVFLIDGFAV